MGYRGKVEEQERARALRARNMTLQEIATELGVSKSSVSLWVRDVPFAPSKRRTGPHRRRILRRLRSSARSRSATPKVYGALAP
jgi:predicted transcriptional regulator